MYCKQLQDGDGHCNFSVHLAQRVLQLERDNTSLRQEVEQGQDDYKQLQDEVLIK